MLPTTCRTPSLPATPAAASINRIRIVDLPDLDLDDGVRGESAYHLVSGPALVRYAQAAGAALALPPELREGDPASPEVRRELPRLVDARLTHADLGVRQAARAIAARLGRNLAYVLMALQRGDAANRAARPDWPPEAWARWAGIRTVLLGGGLVSGNLGSHLIAEANALLVASGSPMVIRRSPWPRDMALFGAARHLPAAQPGAWRALCLDLGQTSVKRAVVSVRDGQLEALTELPAQEVPWRWRNDPTARETIDGREVLDFVVATIVDGWAQATDRGMVPSPELAISIAAYTDGGRLLGNGIYARIHAHGDDARTLIAAHVADRCGTRPRLRLIHDGTAAAALHAGESHSAVIVVGTALGAGFPPARATGLLRLAESRQA